MLANPRAASKAVLHNFFIIIFCFLFFVLVSSFVPPHYSWFSAAYHIAIKGEKLHVQGHVAPVSQLATSVHNTFIMNSLWFFMVGVPHFEAGRYRKVTQATLDFLT
jgi:hypothetical protein